MRIDKKICAATPSIENAPRAVVLCVIRNLCAPRSCLGLQGRPEILLI